MSNTELTNTGSQKKLVAHLRSMAEECRTSAVTTKLKRDQAALEAQAVAYDNAAAELEQWVLTDEDGGKPLVAIKRHWCEIPLDDGRVVDSLRIKTTRGEFAIYPRLRGRYSGEAMPDSFGVRCVSVKSNDYINSISVFPEVSNAVVLSATRRTELF